MYKLLIASLSQILGVTRRTVQRRARREKWPGSSITARGGQHRVFAFADLPEEIRVAVMAYLDKTADFSVLSVDATEGNTVLPLAPVPATVPASAARGAKPAYSYSATTWLSNHAFHRHRPPLTDAVLDDPELIRVGILTLAMAYVAISPQKKIASLDHFAAVYNRHEWPLQDGIYHCRGRISRITLLRWANRLLSPAPVTRLLDANCAQLHKMVKARARAKR